MLTMLPLDTVDDFGRQLELTRERIAALSKFSGGRHGALSKELTGVLLAQADRIKRIMLENSAE